MENHGGRPEVTEAFKDGIGEAIRKSETLIKTHFIMR